jgi:hypothetical protein
MSKETTKALVSENPNKVYEEWFVTFIEGEPEKIKKIRGNIKIRAEEADTLNLSASAPEATNPRMYFLANE